MQKIVIRSLLTALVVAFALTPLAAFAHDGESEGDSTTTTNSEKRKDQIEAAKEKSAEARLAAKEKRLTTAKLRICEARTKNITTIMSRAVIRAEKQVKVFSSITERVQAFYDKKGNVLENYDQLVAAVDQAKSKVQTDVETLKNMDDFSCDSDDPKASVDAFKGALKIVNEDLKAYRTTVKNLIVGVKSVQPARDDSTGGTE